MTEWDQKLAKIVEETERHLASVKVSPGKLLVLMFRC